MGGHFGWRYAFLAGVRSPPLRGGEPRTDGLAGRCRGETKAFPCGRAEPAPPRGGQLQRRSPTGERPEMTREVVFSEGRGLRARVVRPETSRGTSILWTSRREAGGRRERAIRLALCRHRGRAEPAPPRNRDPDKGNQRLQRRDASAGRDADIMRGGGARQAEERIVRLKKPDANVLTRPLARFFSKKEAT